MSEKRSVLIIDDDPELVLASGIRLRAQGYAIESAYDGKSGLEAILASRPDLVILDVRMPQMSGLQVLRQVKSSASLRDTPVIILSASVVDEAVAMESGAAFFIRKPFNGSDLMAAVEAAVSSIPDIALTRPRSAPCLPGNVEPGTH